MKKILLAILGLIIIISCTAYLYRTNIYYPVELDFNEDTITNHGNTTITTISILGIENQIYLNPYSKTYKLDHGYFHKILIENHFADNDSIKKSIILKNTETGEYLNYNYVKDQNKTIINSIGEKSLTQKIKRIIAINLNRLIAIILLLSFILFSYWSYKSNNPIINKTLKIANTVLIGGIIFIGLTLLFTAAWHTYPNAEDIALTTPLSDKNIFRNAMRILIGYDARFTANLLYGFNPYAFVGYQAFYLNSIISIFLIIFSIFIFLSAFLKKNIRLRELGLFSIGILLLHIAYSEGIAYDFFYMGSSFVYLYAWIFNFIWIGLFILRTQTNKNSLKTILTIASSVFLILSMGCVELNIFINLSLLLILFILFYNKIVNKLKHDYIVLFISYIVGIVSVLLIPGYSNRIIGSPVQYSLPYIIDTFSNTLWPFLNILTKWTLLPFTIPIITGITIYMMQIKNKTKDRFSLLKLILIFTILLGTMYSCYYIFIFTSKNLNNNGYPIRLLNLINWLYLVLMFLILPLILSKLFMYNFQKIIKMKQQIILFTTFSIFFYFHYHSNEYARIKNQYFSGEYRLFKTEMELRFLRLENCNSTNPKTFAIIKELNIAPSTLFVKDKDFNKYDPELPLWIQKTNRHYGCNKIIFENDTLNNKK